MYHILTPTHFPQVGKSLSPTHTHTHTHVKQTIIIMLYYSIVIIKQL